MYNTAASNFYVEARNGANQVIGSRMALAATGDQDTQRHPDRAQTVTLTFRTPVGDDNSYISFGNTSAGTSIHRNGLVIDNFVVYEVREASLFTVTFIVDDEVYSEITVEEGELVTAPDAPQKEGYTFRGWMLDDEEFDFNTAISENITLTAKWTPVTDPKPETKPKLVSATSSAVVNKLKSTKNSLKITVTGTYSDGSKKVLAERTYLVKNNSSGTYKVGNYKVYVKVKSGKLSECYIRK
jgi:uncharacterized repeat protein (TIGR02543 family)